MPRKSDSLSSLADMRHLTIRVKGESRKFDVLKELRLIRKGAEDAEDAVGFQAERFAFWSLSQDNYARLRRSAEAEHERVKERLYLAFRSKAKDREDGFEGMTEREINAEVRCHPDTIQARDRLDLLLHKEDICRTMVRAFDHRRSAFLKLWKAKEPE